MDLKSGRYAWFNTIADEDKDTWDHFKTSLLRDNWNGESASSARDWLYSDASFHNVSREPFEWYCLFVEKLKLAEGADFNNELLRRTLYTAEAP
mmetsp:Transcript_24108/g.40406  ORF Transcript_24108/g.40406 Transcript_24108/m.40406 type:complete len:94 (-) Transcript_24108:21-302(-)